MRTSLAVAAIAALAAVNGASAAGADCSAPAFQANSCAVCQTQPLPAGAGDKTISDIVFTWKNTGTAQQVIYDNEQAKPQLVLVGTGASYKAEPSDAAKFWTWSPALTWVAYSDYKEYVLDGGKQVDTHVSGTGSAYVVTTGALPAGAPVALVKSTIAYHDIDANFEEGPKKEYTACTLYANAVAPEATGAAAAPEAVASTGSVATGAVVAAPEATGSVAKPAVSAEAKAKITSRMTKVATGPAENLVAVLALVLGAVAVLALRRKSRA